MDLSKEQLYKEYLKLIDLLANHQHRGYDSSSKLDAVEYPKYPIRTLSSSDHITVGDRTVLVDASSAAVTVTLPSADVAKGTILNVKKIDSSANAVTIDGFGSETIDGAATKSSTTQYATWSIHSDGNAWYII